MADEPHVHDEEIYSASSGSGSGSEEVSGSGSGSVSEEDSGKSSEGFESVDSAENPVNYMSEDELIHKSYKYQSVKLSECPLLGRACDNGSIGLFSFTMCYWSRKLYIFGGKDHWDNLNGNVIIYDTVKDEWRFASPQRSPPARKGHSANVYGDSMFVYGGIANAPQSFGDFWEFDFKTEEWIPWHLEKGPKEMPSRNDHGSSVHNGHLVVFGGIETDGRTSVDLWDMWSIDLSKPQHPRFEHVRASGMCPTPIHNSAATGGDIIYAWKWGDLAMASFDFDSGCWRRMFTDEFIEGQVLLFKYPFVIAVDGIQKENVSTYLKVWDVNTEDEPSLRRLWMCEFACSSHGYEEGYEPYPFRSHHGAVIGENCRGKDRDGICYLYMYGGLTTERYNKKKLNDLWLVKIWEEALDSKEIIKHN